MTPINNFKKSLILTFAALFCSQLSCQKLKELVSIEVPVSFDIDFQLPVVQDTGYATFYSQPEAINLQEAIAASDTRLDINQISSVRLKACTLSVCDQDQDKNDNFQSFSSLKIEFSTDTQPGWVDLATIEGIPPNPFLFSPVVNTETELKNYLNSRIYTYVVSGRAIKTTKRDISCKARIEIMVQGILK